MALCAKDNKAITMTTKPYQVKLYTNVCLVIFHVATPRCGGIRS